MFSPGPEATHSSLRSHDGPGMSQGLPDFWHRGPRTFGVTSPRFEDANAATNCPCAMTRTKQKTKQKNREKIPEIRVEIRVISLNVVFCQVISHPLTLPIKLSGFIFCSNNTDAYPTLSDDTSLLLLFMLVACTAYQLITPSGMPYKSSNFNCTMVLSTSCSYLKRRVKLLILDKIYLFTRVFCLFLIAGLNIRLFYFVYVSPYCNINIVKF